MRISGVALTVNFGEVANRRQRRDEDEAEGAERVLAEQREHDEAGEQRQTERQQRRQILEKARRLAAGHELKHLGNLC